ncbi:uncharacterized protein [Amphiura filiformis]|uniref:uncharacterized protein n=1 Tax=Amphiura filiformis TaxID=82378 RepID=UPI003B222CD7
MNSSLLLAVIFVSIGCSQALFCYKCAGSICHSPITTEKDEVYITQCSGVCYHQTLYQFSKETITRGCYNTKTDCVPGCFGKGEHQLCERCCEKNLCNGASYAIGSLPVLLFGWFLVRILAP